MDYKCNVCIKVYSSYQSLWKHTKKYHNDNQHKINKNQHLDQHEINTIIPYNKLICKFCKKTFSFMQSRWRHEQKCKIIVDEKDQEKQINEIKIAEINKEIAPVIPIS